MRADASGCSSASMSLALPERLVRRVRTGTPDRIGAMLLMAGCAIAAPDLVASEGTHLDLIPDAGVGRVREDVTTVIPSQKENALMAIDAAGIDLASRTGRFRA